MWLLTGKSCRKASQIWLCSIWPWTKPWTKMSWSMTNWAPSWGHVSELHCLTSRCVFWTQTHCAFQETDVKISLNSQWNKIIGLPVTCVLTLQKNMTIPLLPCIIDPRFMWLCLGISHLLATLLSLAIFFVLIFIFTPHIDGLRKAIDGAQDRSCGFCMCICCF